MKSPSKVTVIGGSGFVGTNFCQRLADNQISFEIIDLKISQRFPGNSKKADVRNINSLRKTITGDVIVNLAAVHRDDVLDKGAYYQTNVLGAENIAKICSEKSISRIVFTSSVAVYGFAEPGATETGAINPFNEYGRTKFLAEEVFRAWQQEGENSLIIIRPTVIFGEGNRGNVYNLLSQVASNRFLMIGSGKNHKSMAYVENVSAFIQKCIQIDHKYALYNYIDKPHLTMNELVQIVRRRIKGKDDVGMRVPYWVGVIIGTVSDLIAMTTKKRLAVSSIRVKKFCSTTLFESTEIETTGFQAPYTVIEGLERTLRSEFISPNPDREIFFSE